MMKRGMLSLLLGLIWTNGRASETFLELFELTQEPCSIESYENPYYKEGIYRT